MNAMMPRMREARARTLAFVRELDDEVLSAWPDPDFSPLCWHIGHVAFTEAHWALRLCGGDPSHSAPHARRFAQDGCAKAERAAGYDRDALFSYLHEVRELVAQRFEQLDAARLGGLAYLDWFLACHEHQHRETMALVLRMVRSQDERGFEDACASARALECDAVGRTRYGGVLQMGGDGPLAYDNEQPGHRVDVADFELADAPVRTAEWAEFVREGMNERELFDEAGWRFINALESPWPLGWRCAGDGFVEATLEGWRALSGDEAVYGVSLHEARAFARWRGATLPSEAEWELAAQSDLGDAWLGNERGPRSASSAAHGMRGNVWEWTRTAFAPYEGFRAHPYRGYSTPYFDGAHFVLRGGSFATDPMIATPHFRNWYVASTRQLFCGLRLRYSI